MYPELQECMACRRELFIGRQTYLMSLFIREPEKEPARRTDFDVSIAIEVFHQALNASNAARGNTSQNCSES